MSGRAIVEAMRKHRERPAPWERLPLRKCTRCGDLAEDLRPVFVWCGRRGLSKETPIAELCPPCLDLVISTAVLPPESTPSEEKR